MTYEQCWHLDKRKDQQDCAWLIVYSLKPMVVHCGTPCTKMCAIGQGQVDKATQAQNDFTWRVATHQHAHGRGASIENPKGSSLPKQPKFEETFGRLGRPKPGWAFYRTDGCQ